MVSGGEPAKQGPVTERGSVWKQMERKLKDPRLEAVYATRKFRVEQSIRADQTGARIRQFLLRGWRKYEGVGAEMMNSTTF